jgi:hypothetical protein
LVSGLISVVFAFSKFNTFLRISMNTLVICII